MSLETSKVGPKSQRSKVFWTDLEKAKVISRAQEIQSERPDMAGLPLLREAMMALPVNRRRKVVAVTQASWFENGLKAEVHKAKIERTMNDPIVQAATANNQQLEINNQVLTEWREETSVWRSKVLVMHDQMIALLLQILSEIRSLNNYGIPRAHRANIGNCKKH